MPTSSPIEAPALPAQGLPAAEILERLASYRSHDLACDERTWAYVYDAGQEVRELARQASAMFLSENGLDPTAFPSLLRFENELVALGAAHLGGDAEVVGNFTSGGTESILLAVKAARDRARSEITQPEMVLPTTAHAAFHKAAHYFGLKTVSVDVDASFRADPPAMRAAINERTVLLVGSAASYAHGVVDPIEELAAIAVEHDLWLHVDACIGGFLLPYLARLGQEVPAFDFRLPGVCSISMDLHKYAYTPKGASLILYRNKELRRHQFFACADWTGYALVNATVQSTKSAAPLAAAWAVVHHLGDAGYLRLARSVRDTTRQILAGLEELPDLRVLGAPDMSLIAFGSDSINLFALVDAMKARGWHLQPQLAFRNAPSSVHLTVTAAHERCVPALIADLRASVEEAREQVDNPMLAGLAAAVAGIDPEGLEPEAFLELLAAAGLQGTALPERMADVHSILNALPKPLVEALLVAYFNELYAGGN